MAFGSYDESDQRDQEYTIRESDGEDADLHEHDHEGTVSFDSGAPTADLLGRLAAIKDEDGSDEA